MGIGTSLGAYFDDSFHHQAGIETPPEVVKPGDTGDDNVLPPAGPQPEDKGNQPQPVSDTSVHSISPMTDTETGVLPMLGGAPMRGTGLGGIPPEELGRLARQGSNISPDRVSDEDFGNFVADIHRLNNQPGHPMDPEEAANNYHALPSGANIRFAHEYAEHATDSQWEQYERLVNDPLRQTPFIEHPVHAGEALAVPSHIDQLRQDIAANEARGSKQVQDIKQSFEDSPPEALMKNRGVAMKPQPGYDPEDGSGYTKYHFMNDKGNVGELTIQEKQGGKLLWVPWMGTVGTAGPQDIGHSEVRAMLPIIKQLYPNAEQIGGFRISGARGKAFSQDDAFLRLRPPSPENKTIGDLASEYNQISPNDRRNLLSDLMNELHGLPNR